MEIGSISDVFIAFANVVMACAAGYAAFKAKNWLAENMHSDAYLLVKELVIDDYTHCLISVRNSYFSMFKFSDQRYEFDNTESRLEVSLKNYTSTKENGLKTEDISKKLILLNKCGFSLSKKASPMHDRLNDLTMKSLELHSIFWLRCIRKEKLKLSSNGNNDSIMLNDINTELKSLYREIGSTYDELKECYSNLVENNTPLMEYLQKNDTTI